MARTKQTARSHGGPAVHGNNAPIDEEDRQEIEGQLTEEDKRKRAELEQAPMKAELMHLEKRWTKKGRGYFCEPKEDDEVIDDKSNWYEKYALCVTRQFDGSNTYIQRTSLQVNSPALKQILKDVISAYPGESLHSSEVTLNFPPRCLYHYREELAAHLAKVENENADSEAAVHLPVLMDFIAEHFVDTIKESDSLREQGMVTYEHLWTIFRPGVTVFSDQGGQPRAFKLVSFSYQCGNAPGLALNVEFVDFDGTNFGTRYRNILVPAFSGAQNIIDLRAFPIDFHPNNADIVKKLTARGQKWEAHAGQTFCEYTGVASDPRGYRYNVNGRVMLDPFTFHRIEPDHQFDVNPFPNAPKTPVDDDADEMDELPEGRHPGKQFAELTDDQRMLATPILRGFSFTEKKFLNFDIDNVSDIEWNSRCFEQLVLPDSQKELVQALVAEHTQRTTDPATKGFDDIVKGKGLGLILVLHGPPGVGKTLTAECVAEFSKRPLYIVSSGDLGTNASTLDERLARTMDLASTWKAVLLIDEADVFLERRSLHDMERNGLVSIFLRTLEYYSGILFMTTNRVRTFDDAFKSRIHVPLKYDELPATSRKRIWQNFLEGVEGGVTMDGDGLDRLAAGKLNGRQIKNVVRTAKSLAAHKRVKLDTDQLQQVMDIQMAFERDLAGVEDDIDMVET